MEDEKESKNLEKGQSQILNWMKGINIALFISLATGLAYLVKKDDLTFDSQEQKNMIIRTIPERLDNHTKDPNSHMSFQEKGKLLILEQKQNTILENQMRTNAALEKVGTDLQEIKNLTRQNNRN